MPEFTADELARYLEGEVRGDGAVVLTGLAPADDARPGDLTYAEGEAFFAQADGGHASAILTALDVASAKTVIRVGNARLAFARSLALFFPDPPFAPGIHPSAVVAPAAQVDPTAHVGPLCVVGPRTRLEARVALVAGVMVGEDCVVGEDARVFANATLYPRTRVGARVRVHAGAVLGSDGYGYVFAAGVHHKVPQVGHLVIEDDVEIGANVTIDRGALGATVVGKGTKVDNLVHLAHNVRVGAHCLLIAQVGIAGSTQVGDYVTMAGQVGVADHVRIGSRVTLGAQSGVMNDIPDGQVCLGAPARPALQVKRQVIAVEKLPALLRRVAELERQVAALRGESTPPD